MTDSEAAEKHVAQLPIYDCSMCNGQDEYVLEQIYLAGCKRVREEASDWKSAAELTLLVVQEKFDQITSLVEIVKRQGNAMRHAQRVAHFPRESLLCQAIEASVPDCLKELLK